MNHIEFGRLEFARSPSGFKTTLREIQKVWGLSWEELLGDFPGATRDSDAEFNRYAQPERCSLEWILTCNDSPQESYGYSEADGWDIRGDFGF